MFGKKGTKVKAMLLHEKGVAFQSRGRFEEARKELIAAVKAWRKAKDKDGLAASLSQLAQVHFQLQDGANAIKCVRESSVIRTELNDFRGLSIDYQLIGTIMMAVGQSQEAFGLFRDALGLATGLEDDGLKAGALANLGLVSLSSGMHDEAEQFFKQSQELRKKLRDRLGIAKNLNHLGKVMEARGKRDEAGRLYRESLSLLRELGSPEAEIAADNLRRL
ncbi:MAG TPA: tetratricopeptide repeat protein [Phycisphaerae bacterium]|nr:tetratricopeptide repeat protein [Phycisphaerae bacterium]HUU97955.1 tetratricopeptide repeat protein [Phycisphaerae bacterium]